MRRWVLLAVVLAVAAAGVLVVRDVRRAEAALTEARELLSTARGELADGDLASAREDLSAAVSQVTVARGSVDGPIWGGAAALPGVGDGPRTVRAVVQLASVAVELAHEGLEQAAPHLGDGGELAITVDDGRVDLETLTSLGTVLTDLPRDRLRAARRRLAATGDTLVPERVRTARSDALGLADEMGELLDVATRVTRALPPFLGTDGPREYLLALQNPAELRATGGLIGLIAVARFDDGAFSLVPPSELQEADERLEDTDLPAGRAPPAYEDRYGPRDGTRLLQNANLDPDLPTVAPVLLDLWDRRVGAPLDGVVAIDPLLLADLVRAMGPLSLPATFTQDPRIPEQLSGDALLEAVSVDAYEVFGGDSPERKAFLEAVSTTALERLLAGTTDVTRLVDVLIRNATERHLQLFSTEPDEQEAFRALGIAGALAPGTDTADLLAATANNAGANKQDVHVGHAVDWDIRLQDLTVAGTDTVSATRHATTTVLVDNPLPTSGLHPWILESVEPGQGFGLGEGVPGLNRTWFSLWLPPGGEVRSGRGPDGPLTAETNRIHDQHVVDVFLETPSRSRRSFQLETVSPVTLSLAEGRLRYEATLWRQAKAIPDDVRLVVHAPAGWQVATADLRGGGDGSRPDLSTDPRPEGPDELRVTIEDDRVTVRGQMTADAHVTVDLVPTDS